jgi:hypothetical protein
MDDIDRPSNDLLIETTTNKERAVVITKKILYIFFTLILTGGLAISRYFIPSFKTSNVTVEVFNSTKVNYLTFL